MTVTSWTEFRIYLDGLPVATTKTEAHAKKWAGDMREFKKNPDLKYVCKEVSVAELPKRKFPV